MNTQPLHRKIIIWQAYATEPACHGSKFCATYAGNTPLPHKSPHNHDMLDGHEQPPAAASIHSKWQFCAEMYGTISTNDVCEQMITPAPGMPHLLGKVCTPGEAASVLREAYQKKQERQKDHADKNTRQRILNSEI